MVLYISIRSSHFYNSCWFFITDICAHIYLKELIFIDFIEIYRDLKDVLKQQKVEFLALRQLTGRSTWCVTSN